MVCHIDGNPLNNRPNNLKYGDARENAADAARHGVLARGERNGMAKITADDARAIRAASGKLTEIGGPYGLSETTTSRIRRGLSWAHV